MKLRNVMKLFSPGTSNMYFKCSLEYQTQTTNCKDSRHFFTFSVQECFALCSVLQIYSSKEERSPYRSAGAYGIDSFQGLSAEI